MIAIAVPNFDLLYAGRRPAAQCAYASTGYLITATTAMYRGPHSKANLRRSETATAALRKIIVNVVASASSLALVRALLTAHTRPDKPAPGAACDCSPLPSHPASAACSVKLNRDVAS